MTIARGNATIWAGATKKTINVLSMACTVLTSLGTSWVTKMPGTQKMEQKF